MSDHAAVVKLHDWLKNQQPPTPWRAEKFLKWAMRKSPLFEKTFNHIFSNEKKSFWVSSAILLFPSFSMISAITISTFLQDTAFEMIPMYCMAGILLPYIISFCLNLRWRDAVNNLTPSHSAEIENILQKCDRVVAYHPELLDIIQRVRHHMNLGSSHFQTQQLHQILLEILTQTPLNVSVETSRQENSTGFRSTYVKD